MVISQRLFSTNSEDISPAAHDPDSVCLLAFDRNKTLELKNPNDVDWGLAEEPFSVIGFLRKVLNDKLGNHVEIHHELIVTAVHAVFLDSGFVGFDPVAKTVIDGLDFPTTMYPSLSYTLPILCDKSDVIHSILLKFQARGRYIDVYGSTDASELGKNTEHFVRLNEDKLKPFLKIVLTSFCVIENSKSAEKEVLKFWRDVKDNLASPLLIKLCEKAGLDLPTCFMKLPSDLKLNILERIPAIDVAKVSCVCSELKLVASNNELWRIKYNEEFDKNLKEPVWLGSWKKGIAGKWGRRKKIRKYVFWFVLLCILAVTILNGQWLHTRFTQKPIIINSHPYNIGWHIPLDDHPWRHRPEWKKLKEAHEDNYVSYNLVQELRYRQQRLQQSWQVQQKVIQNVNYW